MIRNIIDFFLGSWACYSFHTFNLQNIDAFRKMSAELDLLNKEMRRNIFAIDISKKQINNLVDRLTQLEQTVQCLSDDNQQLIAKLYSKKGE